MSLKRVVVLISGSGSNLQAIIDRAGDDYEVVAVISNRPKVKGLERANSAGIKTETLDHKGFDSRASFDQELAKRVQHHQPDIVALAGFMRILTPEFVQQFSGKMLNIHPSLLPKYAGLNTHQRAIDAGDKIAGCTVHFVTEALDGGPAAIQAEAEIEPNDNAISLAAKVLVWEHQIYPEALTWFSQERLKLSDGKSYLDGKALPISGYKFS